MSTTVTITGGTAPEVTVGDAGASVSVPSVTGVLSLNGLSGAVTLAVVGGTIAAAGNTLTITVTGGGASSWGDLTGKPFNTLGTGLSVVAGVLSATGLAIADTTGLQAALDGKAPLASPTFTGTVSGVTKAMVGLGMVDNVADASKPVSTAQAAADAVVQAYAIQRANHTGTQAVGTITGLGSLATQSGTFSGTSSGTNTGDQTASTVSVAGGYTAFSPIPLTVEGALSSISGALDNKADSSPATTVKLGPIIVGTGLAVTSGTVSVSYGTSSSTACVGNDSRLSDARTPTAHTQAWSTITATPTTLAGYGITDAATSTHTHGNLTNAGAIGSTSGQIVVTTTSGVLTTAATISASAISGLATVATSGSGSDITTGTVAAARLGTHASTHQTGGTDAVAAVVVSPTALSASTNNWSIGTGDVFRVSASAAYDITGIAAGTSGLAILLVNVGSYAITLKHQSASSTAANRFTVPWAGDFILAAAGGNAVLVYDSTTATWRVL